MKHNIITSLLFIASIGSITAQGNTHLSQMEKINRGVVAIHKPTGGNFISWRLLGTDNQETTFTVLRNGVEIANNISLTNFNDSQGKTTDKYQIITLIKGTKLEESIVTETWDNIYKTIKLRRPDSQQMPDGTSCTFFPQESSVADLDGDGEYEIIIKWLPTNQKDPAQDGYTGNCILDAYRLDGTFLWRIDLGNNIRSGSHYTQFMVYDFNGDGKAELICKTAPGSKDSKENFVSSVATDEAIKTTDNYKDYRTSKGRILSGPEYLTVFEGTTGKAIHTIWYNPNRGFTTGKAAELGDWGDTYGNRGERYLACVAFLDGPKGLPSAVMCRGYYTRSYLWAVDFNGKQLSTKWLHASISKSMYQLTDGNGNTKNHLCTTNTSGINDSHTAFGQGCHNIAVADVDGDGADEIVYGGATINNDGNLLYSTGLGHGDALHVGDFMPDRPGLEVFQVHEEAPYGFDVHDALTGELLIHKTGNGDTGAGLAADIDIEHRGFEFWTSDNKNVYDGNGNIINTNAPSYRHRLYWDGTALDNILNKTTLTDGKGSTIIDFGKYGNSTQWGSKGYMTFFGDLFGDWREEVIYFDKTDSCTLNIFSTTMPTKLRVPTLMHDHQYRMSIAWQNCCYNMAPRQSYYLPDSVGGRIIYDKTLSTQNITKGMPIQRIQGIVKNCTKISVNRTLLNGAVVKFLGVPSDFIWEYNENYHSFSIEGTPQQEGLYEIVLKTTGNVIGREISDTIRINVTNDASNCISNILECKPQITTYYDLMGNAISKQQAIRNKICILRRGSRTYLYRFT